MTLDRLLKPKSVAVVGASPNPSFVSGIFRNVVRYLPLGGVTIAVLTNQGVADPAKVADRLLDVILPTVPSVPGVPGDGGGKPKPSPSPYP